ncbi:MAG TPA: ATP-binding cassette domain-containing protein [Thermoanaerobaculia bacterium]|nr:ATP-binding cassette domain-containing protein [Thermoanaerobaculia bacterium]
MRLTHITKSFGANRAVDDVSLEVRAGEILALVGENGAGKTTLMRIAAGELAPDAGSLERNGSVELVHQHFMLVAELSIAENLALASRNAFRFATRATLEAEARATIAASGIELAEVSRRVGDLSVGEKSKLELIKAIAKKPATLVLDEPTSVLTPFESEELFRVMRGLAADGTGVVFISHKLPEVLAVAERVVVMRGGRVVAEKRARETTAQELAAAMLEQRTRSMSDRPTSRGEILAIVGVAGNGQTELASRLRDEHPEAAHIPEDRTRDGIIAEMSIAENLALRGVRNADELIALYSIRAKDAKQRAGDLSGGNQQKVVLARELHRKPRTIVAAEPTRGLDIEAARFVHDQLRAAADDGASITLITSDLDEAFALADAIQVIYRGKLSERMTPHEATARVANLMAGVS